MNPIPKNVYLFEAKCLKCNETKPIYYTLSDFGDAPLIKKCKSCDAHYWYTLDDAHYIRPLDKQLEGKKCIECGVDLSEVLVDTHTHIKCCNSSFSLDADYANSARNNIFNMDKIAVYLIYSEEITDIV
jgi:hypothetical protein